MDLIDVYGTSFRFFADWINEEHTMVATSNIRCTGMVWLYFLPIWRRWAMGTACHPACQYRGEGETNLCTYITGNQCSGSTCFLASRIRIH
jgi:hypothetical protein